MSDNTQLLAACTRKIGKTRVPIAIMRLQTHARSDGKSLIKRRTRTRTKGRTRSGMLGIKRAVNGNQAFNISQKRRPILFDKRINLNVGRLHRRSFPIVLV